MLETWRDYFRRGFLPLFSTQALVGLLKALKEDDPRLIQGATTSPPPLQSVQDWPCEAGCFTAFCGMCEGLKTVGECEEYFARTMFECDRLLGIPTGCRFVLNWWDDNPRAEMLVKFGEEVELELLRRGED